jgi:Zn-dependent peptidase ImmA (M78 family)
MKKIKIQVNDILQSIHYKENQVELNKIGDLHKIIIRSSDLPMEVSGVLDCRDRSRPIILVNNSHHENRRNFTIAHELGHFFLHGIGGVHMDQATFFRKEDVPPAHAKMEREANQFAAQLLMPEDILVSKFHEFSRTNTDRLISHLADYFHVSEDAMFYRLKNLNLDFGI